MNNNKEPDFDKMIKELMKECELRKAIMDLCTILMCKVLLENTKHKADLYAVAKMKVIETLEPMQIYKDYIKKLITEN